MFKMPEGYELINILIAGALRTSTEYKSNALSLTWSLQTEPIVKSARMPRYCHGRLKDNHLSCYEPYE